MLYYYLFISPALLLMMWAQWRIKTSYHRAMQIPAPMSGEEAARYILEQAGLPEVAVQATQGELSDHYNPSDHTVYLSAEVYHSRSIAAVGIAAHEVGHAIQHARGYFPLVMRNIAVPAARFGPMLFIILLILGAVVNSFPLMELAVVAYGGLVLFQIINLPVEFDASNRAKRILSEHNIVDEEGAAAVRDVLNAAGWTYVAATLQSFLTLMYYATVFLGRRDRNRD